MLRPYRFARRAGLLALASVLAHGCSDDSPTRAAAKGPSETSLIGAPVSTVPGGTYSDVNAAGLSVGLHTDGPTDRALAYDGAGGARFLATLHAGLKSAQRDRARAVNAAGWIVGESNDSTLVQRAVLWTSDSSQPRTLGALVPGGWSRAMDVSEGGIIAGEALGADSLQHAFRWDSVAGMQDISGGAASLANAVNDSGAVVGYVVNGAQVRGFVWRQAGGMQVLPTLGGNESRAIDINNAGVVVGRARNAAGHFRAFRWTATGGMVDLGTLGGATSTAMGIDETGMIVGYSLDSVGNTRPFAWTARAGMRDIGSAGYPNAAANGIAPTTRRVAGGGTAAGERYGLRWKVSEVNAPPAITLPAVDSVLEGVVHTFTPAWSDADGDALRFAWSFGDGTSLNVSATTTPPAVQKAYADNGTYTVRVIATDPSSRGDTATQSLVVVNRAPTGSVQRLPNTVYEGQQFGLSVIGISDAPADLAAGIQVSFNCGYGVWQPYSAARNVTCPGTPDDDTIQVGARLRDKDGGVTQYLSTLITHNRLPVATLTAITPRAMALGDTFRVRGTVSDAGVGDGPWRYRYYISGVNQASGTVDELGDLPEFAFAGDEVGSMLVRLYVWDSDDAKHEIGMYVYVSTPVVINEILANEPGEGTAATRAHEFVELVNVSTRPINIGGWNLTQGQPGAMRHRHTFAAGTTLAPGKAIVVFGGASGIPAGLTNAVAASTGALSLDNTASCVFLEAPAGGPGDSGCYRSDLASVDGVSMNRAVDGRAADSYDVMDLWLHTRLSALVKSPGKKVDGSSW